ncbi:MAG: ABC transporter permease [Anaerolineaceae bacterium]|nr:ABC transporter permease [Anaerolineaceae bacterium]
MTKIWQIIKYEYSRHVFRKRFLWSLLSLPMVVLLMVGTALSIAFFETDTAPVGYIDPAGFLKDPLPMEDSGDIFDPVIEFLPYQTLAAAQSDLEAEIIQAIYVLPEDFPQTQDVQLIYLEEPGSNVTNQFMNFVRHNLMASDNLNLQVEKRLADGSLVTFVTLDGSREFREDQWYVIFMPFIAGIIFIFVVMTSGGYLMQAVVEEKENRTMEIVITSVTPGQLMTGKIIGNIGVGLTQLVVWFIFGWIGLKVAGQFVPFLQDFSLPPNYIGTVLLIALPAFVMVAALMAAIGATMTEMREAQQIQSMISLSITVPFYLTNSLMFHPNSTLAYVMSYFPLTSPLTVLIRQSVTVIPAWQMALHVALLVVFAVFSIWFAGKAFRLGMLQYGRKITLKEIFRKPVQP